MCCTHHMHMHIHIHTHAYYIYHCQFSQEYTHVDNAPGSTESRGTFPPRSDNASGKIGKS